MQPDIETSKTTANAGNKSRELLHRVIISGGGTGGHIFPALSIADEIRRRNPEAEIRFVGANGRMEMERVPAAGYPMPGLTVVVCGAISACYGWLGRPLAAVVLWCATSAPMWP